MQQNLPLGRDISRFIIVRYNVAVFLVFLLRKCQFVPSLLVTSILVHISPLSAAGNNGAITATGLVIVLAGFSACQPALPRFSRKLLVQRLRSSSRCHLRSTLPINREAITCVADNSTARTVVKYLERLLKLILFCQRHRLHVTLIVDARRILFEYLTLLKKIFKHDIMCEHRFTQCRIGR